MNKQTEKEEILCARPLRVQHLKMEIDEVEIFYRQAGTADAPVILLPHGYPCSSYQYRNLMPLLGDRWRLIAPDFPGFGYSGTPGLETFGYDFSAYADFLEKFTERLGLNKFAMYLHDYGSQIGLRYAIKHPEKMAALIIQNGDIYQETLGPKYETLKNYWSDPSPENRQTLKGAVSEDGFRDEFCGEIDASLKESVSPDLWTLHWSLMDTPQRREIMLRLMEGLKENLDWFGKYQAYLREHQPPTLIVWGPQDGYMPKESAYPYLKDVPLAELHFVDGGHWALETNLPEIALLIRNFLTRKYL